MAQFPPPDHKKLVERVNSQYPDLLRTNTKEACNEFLMRVAREPEMVAEKWGLLSKPGVGSPVPAGFTYPQSYLDTLPPGYDKNGQKVGVDVLALPDGNRVDIINGSDNHPAPGGPAWNPVAEYSESGVHQWRSTDVYVDVRGWPIFNSQSGPVAARIARLGCSWFPAIRAWKDWPERADQNLDWIERELNPDYYRVFCDLNGEPHLKDGQEDFWSMAGCDITDPNWTSDFHRMFDKFIARKKKLWLTLYGSVTHAATADQQRRNNDTFVRAMAGRWAFCELVSVANEYNVNGWTDALVQAVGSDLRTKVPAETIITLSTPALAHGTSAAHEATNEEMAESARRLYGKADHSGATFITVHICRDRASKWSHPAAFNGIKTADGWTPGLPYGNGEPPGPGASAGGDIADPVVLLGDYQETSEAGWPRYTQHHAWGVFNGELPDQYKRSYDVLNIWEHDNMLAISNAMRDYRAATPSAPPAPTTRYQLFANDLLLPDEQLVAAGKTCQAKYDKNDGNFVLYTAEGVAVWDAKTAGSTPGNVKMNPDGNLVIYDAAGVPGWASHTDGNPGAMLQLNDDLTLVIYADPHGPTPGTALWSSAGGLVS
jgi:hypothetical protein